MGLPKSYMRNGTIMSQFLEILRVISFHVRFLVEVEFFSFIRFTQDSGFVPILVVDSKFRIPGIQNSVDGDLHQKAADTLLFHFKLSRG